ncbi:competence protein ComFC [Tenacibaculum sp. 190524A05c]
MRFLKDFFRVFYPKICVGCSNELLSSEKILCNFCSNDLPILELDDHSNNIVTNSFYGRTKIEKAISFLSFHKKNTTQKLIHELKYNGRQEIGTSLGLWFTENQKDGTFFSNIDYIIPVPIHPKKMRKRGYNQVSSFCKSLSEKFNIPVLEKVLFRGKNSSSQTSKNRLERSKTIENDFMLNHSEEIENKHVLLIDDVITTGATIEACCKELLKTPNLRISVLSIAFTAHT